MYEKFGDTKKE